MAVAHPTAIALTYARSLLELANANQQAKPIGDELVSLKQIFQQEPTLGLFLSDPGIGRETRTRSVERLFGGGRVSPLVFNFLRVLDHNNRLGILDQIVDAYGQMLEEQQGVVEVDVTVAHRLDPDTLEQVRQRVGAALRRTAVVHQYVDESVIGGMVLRVGDQLVDASVRYQLEAVREKLIAATPR